VGEECAEIADAALEEERNRRKAQKASVYETRGPIER
jgi:hypothetical protein